MNLLMLQKRTLVFWTLLMLCGLTALWAGFLLPNDTQRGVWFEHSGFYFVFASFSLWAISLIRVATCPTCWLLKFRAHWFALLPALVLCVSAFLVSPPKIRILYDEPNLIGVGMNLYCEHRASVPENAFFLHGMINEFSSMLDKRPLAFPFLLYATHVLKGYSGYNGFIVNFLAAFCTLFVWYVLLRRWFPPWIAYAGMILLAAYPLFVIYATSSGFEIVNLLFILLVFHFFNEFLDHRTAEQAERLLLTLVILTQCRYESALFLIVFIPFIVWLLPKKEYARLSPLTLAAPLLLLPVAWQDILFTTPEHHEIDNGAAIFSAGHFFRNIRSALISMRGFTPEHGMLAPVFFLSLAGVCWGAVQFFRTQARKKYVIAIPLLAFALSFALLTVLQFSYHLAILTKATTARLGITFLPVLILFALIAFAALERTLARFWTGLRIRSCLLTGCCALLLFAWPVAGIDEGVTWLRYYRRYDSSLHFLETSYPDHNILIIDERAHVYITHTYSSVNFPFARSNMPLLLDNLSNHFFQDILVMQDISVHDQKPRKPYQLDDNLQLQTLYQEQIDSDGYLRISRVVLPKKNAS